MSDRTYRTQRQAAREHKCALCGKPIRPKAEFVYIKVFVDGYYREIKLHIHCDAIMNEYAEQNGLDEISMNNRGYMDIWIRENACGVFLHEDCGREARERYSCPHVLRRIISPMLLTTALKSAKENE